LASQPFPCEVRGEPLTVRDGDVVRGEARPSRAGRNSSSRRTLPPHRGRPIGESLPPRRDHGVVGTEAVSWFPICRVAVIEPPDGHPVTPGTFWVRTVNTNQSAFDAPAAIAAGDLLHRHRPGTTAPTLAGCELRLHSHATGVVVPLTSIAEKGERQTHSFGSQERPPVATSPCLNTSARSCASWSPLHPAVRGGGLGALPPSPVLERLYGLYQVETRWRICRHSPPLS
jgi:hypothetical protein